MTMSKRAACHPPMFADLASLICTVACGCVQQERQSHGYTRDGAVEAGDEEDMT